MFATGFFRLDFGVKDEQKPQRKVELESHTKYKDSLSMTYAKSFLSLEDQEERRKKEESQYQEEEKRLASLKEEISKEREALQKTKDLIEKTVVGIDQLEEKKRSQLAKIYGAMRPEEAAPILLTLNPKMTADIISRIGDERTKGKLLEQIGKLDKDKARSLSEELVKVVEKKTKK
jgi:flagellar motility protein MotE (MotC chaperone)